MKPWILLCAALLLSLPGCGRSAAPPEAGAPSAEGQMRSVKVQPADHSRPDQSAQPDSPRKLSSSTPPVVQNPDLRLQLSEPQSVDNSLSLDRPTRSEASTQAAPGGREDIQAPALGLARVEPTPSGKRGSHFRAPVGGDRGTAIAQAQRVWKPWQSASSRRSFQPSYGRPDRDRDPARGHGPAAAHRGMGRRQWGETAGGPGDRSGRCSCLHQCGGSFERGRGKLPLGR